MMMVFLRLLLLLLLGWLLYGISVYLSIDRYKNLHVSAWHITFVVEYVLNYWLFLFFIALISEWNLIYLNQ